MIQITPFFDTENGKPIYVQLYLHIKKEIESGSITEGTFLPSIRQLSLHLQISKNTIETAYQQLVAEGYVESIPRVGLKVLPLEEALQNSFEDLLTKPPQTESTIETNNKNDSLYDFIYGEIDTKHFPMKIWKKCLQETLSMNSDDLFIYGDGMGDTGLREELRDYLYRSRGVNCDISQIILTAGTQHAISLVCQLLSLHGKNVAMEEPGYDGVRTVFMNHQCNIIPIPLESDGISITNLHSSPSKLVYVTPSHQLPYGMILPINKRIQLLNWAKETGGYIIEDDYDSEFRYQGQPIPSLKALDKNERVIYLGTFSKALLPTVRVSYLVLPPNLNDLYTKKMYNYNQASSPLIHKALCMFMKNGYFERHISRMRKLYQEKHKTLLHALQLYLGDHIKIIGEKSGIHILVQIPNENAEILIEKALGYGVKVYPTTRFWYKKENESPSTVILGFGKLSKEEIVEGIRRLSIAWFGK